MLPKLVITDIDGVWTDGGMLYDQTGNELKKFNTSDSAGVIFLNTLNIPLAIITGEDTKIVARRAEKLNIKLLYQGVSNKVEIAQSICDELDIQLEDCAYIGDDLGDINLLKLVGTSCAPANAPSYVKSVVDFVTLKPGGEGAFREFVERLIEKEMPIENLVKKITG